MLVTAMALLPDLDLLWGRHNMETHSVGFAMLVGLAVYGAGRMQRAPTWWAHPRVALACALAVGSHVLLDWLGSDDSPPLGVMALWPVSDTFYFAGASLFDAASRRYWAPGFVAHTVRTVAREIAILLPVLVGIAWWRSRPRGGAAPRST
jgi:hypothetical protein